MITILRDDGVHLKELSGKYVRARHPFVPRTRYAGEILFTMLPRASGEAISGRKPITQALADAQVQINALLQKEDAGR